MNLNDIRKAFATDEREVELTTPNGDSTGWIFRLRHESSAEVQAFLREYRVKLQDVAMKRKTAQQKQLMAQHEDGLRVAHVAGWKWEQGEDAEKGRPAFSKRELLTVLHDPDIGYHIREFIDREVGSLEDFLARSESS